MTVIATVVLMFVTGALLWAASVYLSTWLIFSLLTWAKMTQFGDVTIAFPHVFVAVACLAIVAQMFRRPVTSNG